MPREPEQDRTAPLLAYIDGLSVQDLREALELLVCAYLFRAADAPVAEKFTGRTAMKGLAELLARTDCDWRVREIVLNLGRVAYQSTQLRHAYYTDGLIALIQRTAEAIGRPGDGRAFAQAVQRHQKALEAGASALFAGGDILESNQAVVARASDIVERALAKFGLDHFSKSDAKMLAGVVTPDLVRKLTK